MNTFMIEYLRSINPYQQPSRSHGEVEDRKVSGSITKYTDYLMSKTTAGCAP
jgi:hypothetical protein